MEIRKGETPRSFLFIHVLDFVRSDNPLSYVLLLHPCFLFSANFYGQQKMTRTREHNGCTKITGQAAVLKPLRSDTEKNKNIIGCFI